MKTTPFLILLSALSSLSFGETPEDNLNEFIAVRAEREATLQSIVAQIKRGLRDGTSGMRELFEAKIDLHEHERESVSSARKKIIPQQKILELEEKRHALVVQLMRSGNATNLEFLRSKERILAAKQLLLQNKVRANSNAAAKVKKEE